MRDEKGPYLHIDIVQMDPDNNSDVDMVLYLPTMNEGDKQFVLRESDYSSGFTILFRSFYGLIGSLCAYMHNAFRSFAKFRNLSEGTPYAYYITLAGYGTQCFCNFNPNNGDIIDRDKIANLLSNACICLDNSLFILLFHSFEITDLWLAMKQIQNSLGLNIYINGSRCIIEESDVVYPLPEDRFIIR